MPRTGSTTVPDPGRWFRRFSRTHVLLVTLLIALPLAERITFIPTSYWLWAGLTERDAPSTAELYVYQGLIFSRGGQTGYQRIGLYPYPLNAERVYLSYRLEGNLPDPGRVGAIAAAAIRQWQRHGVGIVGVQLDFDSAASRLLLYSDFLKRVRQALPRPYELSITGLGDWLLSGDGKAVAGLNGTVDEIVFQLYQGRQSFADSERYLERLRSFHVPFRVGLLPDTPYVSSFSLFALRLNPVFRGVVYLIQNSPAEKSDEGGAPGQK